MIRAVLSVLVAIAIGACAASADDADVATVTGQVMISPIRPGPVRIGDVSEAPYAATLSIQTPDGTQEITQVDTDPQGQFSVQLDPGTYHIVPLTPAGNILPRGIQQDVTLQAGDVVSIVVQYDSGIR